MTLVDEMVATLDTTGIQEHAFAQISTCLDQNCDALFYEKADRDKVMAMFCELSLHTDCRVQRKALELLNEVSKSQYHAMGPYMERLRTTTLQAIGSTDADVAREGLQFWTQICETELDLDNEDNEDTLVAHAQLIPALLACMERPKNDGSAEPASLSPQQAAHICLKFVIMTVKDGL